MKKLFVFTALIAIMISFTVATTAFTPLGTGVQPQVRDAVNELGEQAGLPFIRGQWYYVDPASGSDTAGGKTKKTAVASIVTAYGKCSNNGDGIVLMVSSTSLSGMVSYLTDEMTWAKHNITVVGLGSGSMFNQRAGIRNGAHVAGADSNNALVYLINVTGHNNLFQNMHFINNGDSAVALGSVRVTGARNHFVNCHIVGANNATPGAVTTANDLYLIGSENTFDRCTFGINNSGIREAANGEILMVGAQGQNFFNDCVILSQSATEGKGAIKVSGAATFGGWTFFRNCTFVNWLSGAITANTSLVIGDAQNNCGIILDRCGFVGFAAIADANWDKVVSTGPAGEATGGIGANP